MFDQTSRYYNLKNLTYVNKRKKDDKQVIAYKERRFLPSVQHQMTILQDVTITAGDRLDIIAFRLLGDPEQFWRVCDANEAMHPYDLTSEPGRILHIGIQKVA
jgi:hypothetical protein